MNNIIKNLGLKPIFQNAFTHRCKHGNTVFTIPGATLQYEIREVIKQDGTCPKCREELKMMLGEAVVVAMFFGFMLTGQYL